MRTFACMLIAFAVAASLANATPLDDYVNAYDPTYSWKNVTSFRARDYTVYNIFMTSQTWLTSNDSDSSVWTHWLQICVPDKIVPSNSDIGLLYIDGDSTAHIGSPPTSIETILELFCGTTDAIAARLGSIPNEPVYFTAEKPPHRRSEDGVIAYTWSHFINNTNEPWWLLRMPMTKSVVRAMDTMTAFSSLIKNITPVKRFIVAGASKRGWTTWTTAVVDKRVIGAVPVVAPIGNLVGSINEMWQSYGDWSFALNDYTDMGIIKYLNKPVFQQMLDIVSIDKYYDRLQIPKLMITSAGDEFFMPTSSNYFFKNFQGEALQRVVPNAEHSLAGHQVDVVATVQAFAHSIIHDTPRPKVQYDISRNGTRISVNLLPGSPEPHKVVVYRSHNKKKRDFRLIVCGDAKDPSCFNPQLWFSQELVQQGPGLWFVDEIAPQEGWLGFFIELEFRIGGLSIVDPLKVTSGVSIIPENMPFPPCGETCGRD